LIEMSQAGISQARNAARSGLRRGIDVRVIVVMIVLRAAAPTHHAPDSPIEVSISPRAFASPASEG
jgi:hypothetical protein